MAEVGRTPDPSDDALDFDPFNDGDADDDLDQDQDGPAQKDEDLASEGDADTGDQDVDVAGTDQGDVDAPMVTIDGKKIPISDLTPELINKMATHYNQVGHYQSRYEEAMREKEAADAERRAALDKWTQFQMEQSQLASRGQQTQSPPPRPTRQQIEGMLSGQLQALVQSGEITEDELAEHGGLIGQWLYRDAETHQLINAVYSALGERLQRLEGTVPETERAVKEQSAERRARSVQAEAASVEGYEFLSDPEEWAKLEEFITRKVLSSPKDKDGNPTFDPIFDAQTMREQADAMQGAILRKALAERKVKAEGDRKREAQRGTDAKSGGGTSARRPPARKPGDRSPEEDALDFNDPMLATG